MSTLFVRLAGLLAASHQPDGQPTVVTQNGVVCDLNPGASGLGLRVGMNLREAKSLAPGIASHEFTQKLCEPLRQEWLTIATLYTDEVESLAPHEAFLNLEKHPDPEEIARLLLDHLERRFAFPYVAGLCPTKWVARELAQSPIRVMPIAGLALAREPVHTLQPIEPRLRERLIFLGYKKVKDVQSLPIETLKTQFGVEALRIQAAANGGLHEPVETNFPVRSFTESQSLVGGSADLEQLKAVLSELAGRLFARLCTEGRTAKDVQLEVELEERGLTANITYAKPFRGAIGLQLALIRMLEELAVEEPIFRLTVTLPNLSRVRPKQRTLAGLPVGDTSHTEDALEALRHKFGGYSVHLAKEHVVPRRVSVLRAWAQATGWK